MASQVVANGFHHGPQGIDGHTGICQLRWLTAQFDGGELVQSHGVVGHHVVGRCSSQTLLRLGHLGHQLHQTLTVLGRQGGWVDAHGLSRTADRFVVGGHGILLLRSSRGIMGVGGGRVATSGHRYFTVRGPQAHLGATFTWCRGLVPAAGFAAAGGAGTLGPLQQKEVRAARPPPGHLRGVVCGSVCIRSIEASSFLRADVGFPTSARCALAGDVESVYSAKGGPAHR